MSGARRARLARHAPRSADQRTPGAAASCITRDLTLARGLALALVVAGLAAPIALLAGCSGDEPARQVAVPGRPGGTKSAATVRAERRAFDGAPPVIPHRPMGAACVSCHNQRGMDVAGLGFAPASPHEQTRGLSATSRCAQCHVFAGTDQAFVESGFRGFAQDLRHGERQHPLAPPVMPHPVFMRENCAACHTGPAAREEIRTPHPERERCTQCHVPVRTAELFERR